MGVSALYTRVPLVVSSINVNSAGDDSMLWYFVAPPAFLNPSPNAAPTNRHNLFAFGGSLSFTLSSQAGDFSAGNMNSNLNLVVLECATCNGGHGIRLFRPLNSPLASLFRGTERRKGL